MLNIIKSVLEEFLNSVLYKNKKYLIFRLIKVNNKI